MDTYYDKTKEEQLRPKYAKVNFFPERGLSEDIEKDKCLTQHEFTATLMKKSKR